jgi:hypothetical protein
LAQEYDVQAKARRLADVSEKATRDAVHKAGDLAHDKRDTMTSGLDKVVAKVDARTEGKYADRIAKARTQLVKGIDKLAEQRQSQPGSAASGQPQQEPAAPPMTTPPASDPASASPAPDPALDPTLHEPPRG